MREEETLRERIDQASACRGFAETKDEKRKATVDVLEKQKINLQLRTVVVLGARGTARPRIDVGQGGRLR